MQNRYTADIGDYAKYGLLRHLAKTTTTTPTPLGIAWYLVADENHNDDGLYTSYLTAPDRYAQADPELYQHLTKIITNNQRTITALEQTGILAPAKYHNRQLDLSKIPARQRPTARQAWVQEAINTTKNAPLVFLDPDNGLSIKSTPESNRRAGKYIYDSDLLGFWNNQPQALITYQHVNRSAHVRDQAAQHRARIRQLLGIEPLTIYWRAFSLRMFIIITNDQNTKNAVTNLLDSPWGQWFAKI